MTSEILGTFGAEAVILTAVIPAKNLSHNLDKLLKVLDQQSSEKIDLVLVIDEPEDEAMRVKSALERDSRFQKVNVVYGEYNSPGRARNVGLGEVKTKWVTFWDSDDEPVIEEVLKTVDIANKSQSEVAITRFAAQSVSSGIRQSSTSFSEKKKANMRDISLNPGIWRMSFLTNLARQSSFPNLRMGEDQVFLSRLNMNDRRIYFSNTISYIYRTENSHQLTSDKSNINDLLEAFKLNVENLETKKKDENCKFELQLLGKEFLTLIKNRIVLAPLLILLKDSNFKIKVSFTYEMFLIALKVLKKVENKW